MTPIIINRKDFPTMFNQKKKFALARERLIELDKRDSVIENSTIEENTIEVKPEEIIVYSDVPLERYLKFCEKEQKFHVFIRLKKGNVIAYDMTSSVHGAVQSKLSSFMDCWSDQFIVRNDVDITVGQNSVYCPDIQSKNGCRNWETESLDSLNDLAGEYFSARTNIQIYLAIKIWPRRTDDTAAMLALLYLRNNVIPNPVLNSSNPPLNTQPTITLPNTVPNPAISFGTAPLHHQPLMFVQNTGIPHHRITGLLQHGDIACTTSGMINYEITIPANLLFNAFPGGVPIGVPDNFNIDLWELQKIALINEVCIVFLFCCRIII
ncbi:11616_t:CDS:2 [Racocetra fulgida]|uniref:11616_t:CDS:1 n=1 Tax=Racocetra fulgida TaxID=60492 RepID=A0A9N9ABC4_9GLOM|nr:11616_t:CDS:2 [Racocetra fulgida]